VIIIKCYLKALFVSAIFKRDAQPSDSATSAKLPDSLSKKMRSVFSDLLISGFLNSTSKAFESKVSSMFSSSEAGELL
jgi:hypothetical protein